MLPDDDDDGDHNFIVEFSIQKKDSTSLFAWEKMSQKCAKVNHSSKIPGLEHKTRQFIKFVSFWILNGKYFDIMSRIWNEKLSSQTFTKISEFLNLQIDHDLFSRSTHFFYHRRILNSTSIFQNFRSNRS